MSQQLLRNSSRNRLMVLFASASMVGSGCSRESEKPSQAEEAAPPLDREAVRSSFEALRKQVQDQVQGFRQLRARVNEFPVDLMGLSAFKERIGQTESVLGALAGRTDWMTGELETALTANQPDRIQAIQAQVVSISGDLKLTGQSLLEFAHDLRTFDEAVGLQTSWVYKLPGGFEIKAAPGGLERRLIDFSTDAKREFEPHSWYRFDRIYFLDISTEMNRSRSDAQLTNVVEILKAYPTLQLDLSAFDRDVQRIAEVRERTSARLHVLKNELVDRGIAAKRLRILEHGPDCPPDAPERCSGSAAARPMK